MAAEALRGGKVMMAAPALVGGRARQIRGTDRHSHPSADRRLISQSQGADVTAPGGPGASDARTTKTCDAPPITRSTAITSDLHPPMTMMGAD